MKKLNEKKNENYDFVLKQKIVEALIFSSSDDELIDTIVKNCRLASSHLMAKIFELENLPKLIDRFIINIILLILKSPQDSNKVAKYHEAKKQYKLYLNVATKSFKQGDHNTAWLLNESLNHYAISNLKIPKNSKRFSKGIKGNSNFKEFFSCVKIEYGSFNNCFFKHVSSVPKIPDKTYIPIVPVLHMYSKRTNEHLKATETLGMRVHTKKKLKNEIENLIEIYSNHFSTKLSDININTDENLLGLYKTPVSLPLNIVQNPLLSRNKECDKGVLNIANFSDLCFLSKEVLKSINQKSKRDSKTKVRQPMLKNTDKCNKVINGCGWRSINAYRLALNRKKSLIS